MNIFKLTDEDKQILREWGYPEEDFPQIEEAARRSRYEIENKKITCQAAIGILGREKFLSGIARSAFHWTSVRESEDGRYVFFDSSILFKGGKCNEY